MHRDPYEVLGVMPDSDPAEWKRAYRRLAMRWHPDRSDHPEATERFKEINAAYERICAVDVEEELDSAETSAAPAETEADPADAARAPDIRLNLEISLEEGAAGCRKTIHFHRGKACSTCHGSGEAGLSRTRFCETCHGSGRMRDARHGLIPCTDCGGRGFFSERICPDCAGEGRETIEVGLEISVPPGMLPGDELRLAGQGEAADGDLLAGDLYLTIILRAHALYQLQGRDLHLSMPVSVLGMLAGAEISVPGLLGTITCSLEPGSPEARTIRLAGHGYPGRGKRQAGGLLLELQPIYPQKLSARQRQAMLRADQALHEDLAATLPEIAMWKLLYGNQD